MQIQSCMTAPPTNMLSNTRSMHGEHIIQTLKGAKELHLRFLLPLKPHFHFPIPTHPRFLSYSPIPAPTLTLTRTSHLLSLTLPGIEGGITDGGESRDRKDEASLCIAKQLTRGKGEETKGIR